MKTSAYKSAAEIKIQLYDKISNCRLE